MPRTPLLNRIFVIGLWGKAIDGVLELIGGILLLVILPATLHHLVIVLTQHELVEDPHDLKVHGALALVRAPNAGIVILRCWFDDILQFILVGPLA